MPPTVPIEIRIADLESVVARFTALQAKVVRLEALVAGCNTELERLEAVNAALRKFASHRDGCHCFICRNLTEDERSLLIRGIHAADH